MFSPLLCYIKGSEEVTAPGVDVIREYIGMSRFSVGTMAALTGLVMSAGIGLAAENFIPSGHLYAPYAGPLPPLNSPQDRINAQADVYQSQIWHSQVEQKQFESDWQRLLNRNMSPGRHDSPLY